MIGHGRASEGYCANELLNAPFTGHAGQHYLADGLHRLHLEAATVRAGGRPGDTGLTLARCEFQADEICSFVDRKPQKQWTWVIDCQTIKLVAALYVSGRENRDADGNNTCY